MTDAHEGMTDPRLQAEGELSLARLALDDGELDHAAGHVGNAVVCDPTLPEVYELLARLAQHPDGGVKLFPLEQPAFLGTVVARAHVLAAAGRYAEGLDLLVSAQCHAPDGPWADVPWVRDPNVAARLSVAEIAHAVRRLFTVMGDPVEEERHRCLLPYLDLARHAVQRNPEDPDLLWTVSILLRRMGLHSEAVEHALRSERVQPSFHAAMALGYAYRSMSRWKEAEESWLRALRFEPDNLALYTDIGELLTLAGRPADGLAWVERALERDPDNESAFPTACGMRYVRDQDIAHLVALADYLREHPGNAHAESVLMRCAQRASWLGRIPRPSEAVINTLFQVIDQEGDAVAGLTGTMTVSAPEPPSALLALRRAAPGLEVTISGVPEPDPRVPVPPIHVWTYDGSRALATVPPPSEAVTEALRQAAGSGWRHLPGAYDDAVRLSGLPLDDLLGALVHPPAPSDSPAPGDWPAWIRSVQAWACLAIAHHRSDQPWPESERRAVLVDLVNGPEDWTTETALFALVTTAWVRPETRPDVASIVGHRFLAAVQASQTRAVTILDSLASLVRATPEMQPSLRELADKVLAPETPTDKAPRRRRFFRRRRA